MSDLEHFSITGSRAEFRPRGEMSLHQGSQLVVRAISRTRELGVRDLLMDITQVTGFDSPSLVTRYHLAREWAEAARGAVRLAFVSRPEWIDPGKFGVLAASNIGLQMEVFEREEEAINWLDGLNQPEEGSRWEGGEAADSELTPGAADPSSRGGK